MYRFIRPYQLRWILGIFFDVLGDGSSAILCAFSLEYFANAVLEGDVNGLVTGVVLMIGSYLALFVFRVLFHICFGTATARIKAGLSGAVFHKLLKLPLGNQGPRKMEDQITYMNQDIDLCVRMYTEDLRSVIKSVMMALIILFSIMGKNLGVGLFCLVIFAGNIISNLYFTPKQEKMAGKRQQAAAKLSGVYNDLFAGAMVIKLFGLRKMMMERIEKAAQGIADVRKSERTLARKQQTFANFFLYAISIIPLLVNCALWMLGQVSFGVVFFVQQMMITYLNFCNTLGISIMNLSRCQAGVNRIYDILTEADEIEGFGTIVTRTEKAPAVELDKIDISYGEKRVIRDFSLQINPNETVALVGSSGSGKSTVMKAILQLIDYQGQMKLYGIPAKEYSLEFLRNQMAYVEQEARLFDGTIYENIVYGNRTATEDEVYLAAQKAYARDFILRLPNGYDTIIGENGYKLSGGERQRIAIARAFLKNAPILLLDEATSALDSESEQKVQLAIEELMKGRTILVVAHRLSTIRHADRIVVLEHGVVVEAGSHDGLLAHAGRYKELYQMQFTD